MLQQLTDFEVLQLYQDWSDEAHMAAFVTPSPRNVADFRAWLPKKLQKPLKSFQQKMVEEFRRQDLLS